MKIIETTVLSTLRQKQINILWNKEYPEKITHPYFSDSEKYLSSLEDPFYTLVTEKNVMLAWMAEFNRNSERWFAIIVDDTRQGRGVGTQLLSRAKKRNQVLCGWVVDHNNNVKLNGDPYRSPLGFYLKNGFEVLPEIRIETNGISAVKIQWRQ